MSLQTRLSSLITAIGADIKDHNTRIAALEAQTGRILRVDELSAAAGAGYQPIVNAGYFQAFSGQDMMIAITQQSVPTWWEVSANVSIMQKTDAAYHYAYAGLTLDKADQDGVTTVWGAQFTQHSTVDTYGFRTVRKVFKLAASTTYSCRIQASISGGTWQYYQDPAHLWIEGKLWAQ